MDDESFEDAAEIVSVLGKMVKRGGKAGSSTAGSSVSRAGSHSHSQSSRSPYLDTSVPTTVSPVPVTKTSPNPSASAYVSAEATGGAGMKPAVPNVTMMNPI